MTDEEKAKAALAEKDRRIAELESQLEGSKATAAAIDEGDEDLTPTPTQVELDRAKLGEHQIEGAKAGTYKTRQQKAG